MRINHNIAAMNAWRNLGVSNSSLGGSLEKLSSGYRINRGADDPAGLLISEKLRSQIFSMDQAIRNASDAISMVQTAEGALTEMNNMLNSIRTLAVHAANTGANDTESIAADQTAVDKALESMQRIATTTKYAGKNLLDGSAGTEVVSNDTDIDVTAIGTVNASGQQDIAVNTVATAATATAATAITGSAGGAGSVTMWYEDGGEVQTIKTYNVTLAAGQSVAEHLATAIALINADSATTGIIASDDAGGTKLSLRTSEYGDNITLKYQFTGTISGGVNEAGSDAGSDVAGTINGDLLSGSGLVLYGSIGTEWAGSKFTLSSAGNTVATVGNVSIQTGQLGFSLTDNASASDIIYLSIDDVQINKIGDSTDVAGTNSLSDIRGGNTFQLSADASSAISIIDQAITDVSNSRATLGAFQKFTLQTTINNLGVTKENLSASESRIRDVDMAAEMMEFTKNQILVQAGTAMLAQANQLPSTVLQLLG